MVGGSGGGGGVVKRGRSSKRRRARKVKVENSKSKSKGNEVGVKLEPESMVRDKATEEDEAGSRQKWVEWTCGGCGYIAKGELGSAATKMKKEKKKKEKPVTLPQITPAPSLVQAPPIPAIIPQKSIAPLAQTGMLPGPLHPSRPQTVPPVATKAAHPPVPAQAVVPQISTPLQSANQRAKDRKKKKNNSLQEMLAAKREREAAGGGGKGLGGMDLMDLMKLG